MSSDVVVANEANETVVEIREGEEATELIADQIKRIAEAADALLASGLSDRALIVLLHDMTGLGKRDIRTVLDALPRLVEYVDGI